MRHKTVIGRHKTNSELGELGKKVYLCNHLNTTIEYE